MDDTQTAAAVAAPESETQDGDPPPTGNHPFHCRGEVPTMMNGLPLIVLVFLVALTVLAFWRLVLMICIAAALTLFALGLVDVITFVGDLR